MEKSEGVVEGKMSEKIGEDERKIEDEEEKEGEEIEGFGERLSDRIIDNI